MDNVRRGMVRVRVHGNDNSNDSIRRKTMSKNINDENFFENRIAELTTENREKGDLIRRQQKEIDAMAEEIVTLKEKIVKLVSAYV